jgi:competence ComEA-like helix-hairpin-helix protein
MGLDQQTDTKKDKRLLVLLAFGVLFHFARIFGQVIPDRPMVQHLWGWVEYAGRGDGLQRVQFADDRHGKSIPDFSLREKRNSAELPEMLRRHGAIAVLTGSERSALSSAVSPRLAFLLGRPIPVNRASIDELVLLHGVGPKLAASIVDYRDRHGRIADAQELRAVPGIGKILAAGIAPQLTFE